MHQQVTEAARLVAAEVGAGAGEYDVVWQSRSGPPQKPPAEQADWIPTRQCGQVLSEYMKGAMTKSPARRLRTSAPTSSTIPTNSCPMRVGSVTSLMPR